MKWLLGLNESLIIGRNWRQQQKDVVALPHYFFEPSPEVKAVLDIEWDPETDDSPLSDLIDEETGEENPLLLAVRNHLGRDPVAFGWYCAWYKDRDTRLWKRDLTPGQITIMWRFAQAWHAEKPVRLEMLKQRRGGYSFIITVLMCWVTFFRQNRGTMQTANDKDVTDQLQKYVNEIYERLPKELRPAKRYSRRGKELVLEEPDERARMDGRRGLGSVVVQATVGKAFVGSGIDVQALHCSETGKWHKVCDPEVQFASMTNTIPESKHNVIFCESTAHGAKTWWHKRWVRALNPGSPGWSGFTAIFIPWFFDPRNRATLPGDVEWGGREDSEFGDELYLKKKYDLDDEQLYWRRLFISKQDADDDQRRIDIFKQEYPSDHIEAWLFADGKFINERLARLIDTATVAYAKKRSVQWQGEVEHRRDSEGSENLPFDSFATRKEYGPFRIFAFPERSCQYLVGVDISSGQAEDSTCAKVYQRTSDIRLRVAAEWYGMIQPHDFGHVLWRIGHYYNTAMLAWERTGPGMGIAAMLKRSPSGINNPYPLSKMYRRVKTNSPHWTPDASFGIETRALKRPMLDKWVSYAKSGELELLPEDFEDASDLEIDKKGKINTHGRDRLMSSVMASWAHFTLPLDFDNDDGERHVHKRGTVDWADELFEQSNERDANAVHDTVIARR